MGSAMASKPPSPFRRQYLVNKRYQGRFIALLCGLTVLFATVAGTAVYVILKGVLSEAMYRMHLPTGELWLMIREPLLRANLWLGGAAILVACGVVALVIWRARRALRAVEGEIRAIGIAGGIARPAAEPLWTGVAQAATEGVRERMQPLRDAAGELEGIAERCGQSKEAGVPPAAAELAEELDAVIARIEEGSGGFQV